MFTYFVSLTNIPELICLEYLCKINKVKVVQAIRVKNFKLLNSFYHRWQEFTSKVIYTLSGNTVQA